MKGTPASSQIIWLEDRVRALEDENEKLREVAQAAQHFKHMFFDGDTYDEMAARDALFAALEAK